MKTTALKTSIIAAAALAAIAPLAVLAADLRGAADVGSTLSAAGYAEVREVEFDDGLWEAEVRRADGRWAEVHVDPATGEVFDGATAAGQLDMAGVLAAIERQGFTRVSDLDRDGGTWSAEAIDPRGQRMELRLAGTDGRVLHSDVEWDD
jgi:hypothetical protein